MIFSTELEHSGKMVSLLIGLHLGYSFWLYTPIGPENIKVFGSWLFSALNHQLKIIPSGKRFFYWLKGQAVIEDLFCYESHYEIFGSTAVND